MSLRLRVFIIVSIVIAIITALILLLIQNIKNRQVGEGQNPTTTPGGAVIIDSTNFNASAIGVPVSTGVNTTTQVILDPGEATKTSVRQFARVFVERYGTYSSDNSFQNIRDVETMVTPNLLAFITRSASTSTVKTQSFVGVTAKVVTAEISEWSETQATVKFQTIKMETRGTQTTTTQPSGTVKLVKSGNQWFVDGIYWDK